MSVVLMPALYFRYGASATRTRRSAMLRTTMRILVVEDDEVVQSSVARALRAEGHAVATASDLAAARECVTGGVGLIVLDLRLPDGFGLDLCREIRRDGSIRANQSNLA